MVCVQATDSYVHLRIVTFSYGYLRNFAFQSTDQLRTVTSTYDPADACVRAASTYPYLSAADVTQRKRLCDWGIDR